MTAERHDRPQRDKYAAREIALGAQNAAMVLEPTTRGHGVTRITKAVMKNSVNLMVSSMVSVYLLELDFNERVFEIIHIRHIVLDALLAEIRHTGAELGDL